MNKIGWCSETFNPVWGCLNKCPYCYARGIAKRFGEQIYKKEVKEREKMSLPIIYDVLFNNIYYDFKPTFLYSQFKKKLPKKPQRIFVGSMSEIYYWKKEWVEMVIEKVKQYPQHTFQFLTKHPKVYLEYDFPENCWLGATATKREDIDKNWTSLYRTLYSFNNNKFCKNIKLFCSIEPFLNAINPEYLKYYDWVIIGAESGNRIGKVIPKKEWVLEIVKYCDLNKIPIYIKDNLIKYYPEFKDKKEFPK